MRLPAGAREIFVENSSSILVEILVAIFLHGIRFLVLPEHLQIQAVLEFLEKRGMVVDAAGGVVSPEMPRHSVQNDRNRHGGARQRDDRIGDPGEAVFPSSAKTTTAAL